MLQTRRGDACVALCYTEGRRRRRPYNYVVTNSPAPLGKLTPRVCSTCSRFCNCFSAAIVAFTRFLGLVEPNALVRMSVMPASSTQGRTLLPAVTPVPGRAGARTTVLAPLVPLTWCGMVVPLRVTFTRLLRASFVAFSTAIG